MRLSTCTGRKKLALVAQREWRQLFRYGEDDMRVGHRQQACGLFHEPAVAGRGLTLGTVPVAAGVVSDSLIAAAIAPFKVGAEGRRSASADIAQHLPLLVRESMAPALKELVLVSVEDIGHFEPMSGHAVLFPPCTVRMSRMGRSSSGLAVACSLASETCRYREVVSRSRRSEERRVG